MKRSTRIETFDGRLFVSEGEARRALERLYGEEITKLARQLAAAEKYTKIIEVLEANLDTMQKILIIKADMPLEPDDT